MGNKRYKQSHRYSKKKAQDRRQRNASEKRDEQFLCLPIDTAKIIKNEYVDNLHLYYNKLVTVKQQEDGKYELQVPEPRNFPNSLKIIMNTMLQKYYQRLEHAASSLRQIMKFNLGLTSRLVVGLGAISVYETSIHLHHIYGFPYIPSTALKGVTRHHVIIESFSNNENAAINDIGFRRVFGYQLGTKNSIGEVCFFDAVPEPDLAFDVDVMTPHFLKYYTENKPPTDDQNPIPIRFLTVAPSTKFYFILGDWITKSSTIESGLFKGKKPIELAKNWLIEALTSTGVGAKTTLGYGHFKQV
jgi:CRISPR-associated protein Cmr6